MEKKKTKPFQLIVIGISVALLIGAVIVFSTSDRTQKESGKGVNYGSVSVWGTIPASAEILDVLSKFNQANEGTISANYVYIPIKEFDQALLEALGNDRGPDVLILPTEWLHRNTPRIAPFPFDPTKGGISARDFKDTFTQAGEVFLYPEGIMALPIAIDPLVLYWNRDLFTNAGIVSPPTFWKELLPLTSKLTKKQNFNILQSSIALGEYVNVNHAKDILALMFLQVGNPITRVGALGLLESELSLGASLSQAIKFYTDFANPLKSGYTWNRSLPNSEDVFLGGDLAMYIDYASAYQTLLAKNPRLNFDLASVPQTDGQETAITYGKVHGISVMKRGKNVPGAYMFARLFSAKDNAESFSVAAGMAPMRKDILSIPQSDAYRSILYTSSLRARTWIDPHPVRTDSIFSRMIEAVISGKSSPDAAISEANNELSSLIEGK